MIASSYFLCIKESVKLEVAVRPNNANDLAAAFNRDILILIMVLKILKIHLFSF